MELLLHNKWFRSDFINFGQIINNALHDFLNFHNSILFQMKYENNYDLVGLR